MKISNLRVLRGPNVWTRSPVLEVTLQVAADGAPDQLAALARRFPAWVATGGQNDTGSAGSQLAHAWAGIVLQLQTAAWKPVEFACVERPLDADSYRVLIQYQDEDLAEEAAREALQLCGFTDGGVSPDLQAAIDRLRALASRVCLPESVWAIAQAARARGIPVRRLSRSGVLQLGYGSSARRSVCDSAWFMSSVSRVRLGSCVRLS